MANLQKLEKETKEWGDKLDNLSGQLEALKHELKDAQKNAAVAVLGGADLTSSSNDLATLQKKASLMESVVEAAQKSYETKQAELFAAQQEDGLTRQAALKQQADQVEMDYFAAIKAAWLACVKIMQFHNQEQSQFAGAPLHLTPVINFYFYGVELQKLESFMGSLEMQTPSQWKKAGLSVTDLNKIKAQYK
jgi:hypothetical protein